MPYIANTDNDRSQMLDAIGVGTLEELWEKAGVLTPVPDMDLPPGWSEFEVTRHMAGLASFNGNELCCFLGCGFYDHIIPAAVGDIISRSEFLSSYTPYQPEASQGTLQAVYEFQSHICRLTGMEVSNASMYDGGTALFEAMMMAIRSSKKRNKAILAGTISPIYRDMMRCYSENLDIDLTILPLPEDGTASDMDELKAQIDDNTAVVMVQYPNIFGSVEDWTEVVEYAHERNVVCVASCYPTALSLIKTPGEMGFDIVCGEGQPLGVKLMFGGPYLGYIACKNGKLVRNMPGRICGRTKDIDGKEAFVLTLQAREQHIRRNKATSNICTNEGLCAVAATVYLSCIGKHGFKEIGRLCASKATYLRDKLTTIDGVEALDQPAFFNEFVIRLPVSASRLTGLMIEKGFAAGFPLGRYYENRPNDLLIAVTEKRTQDEMDTYVLAVEHCLEQIAAGV